MDHLHYRILSIESAGSDSSDQTTRLKSTFHTWTRKAWHQLRLSFQVLGWSNSQIALVCSSIRHQTNPKEALILHRCIKPGLLTPPSLLCAFVSDARAAYTGRNSASGLGIADKCFHSGRINQICKQGTLVARPHGCIEQKLFISFRSYQSYPIFLPPNWAKTTQVQVPRENSPKKYLSSSALHIHEIVLIVLHNGHVSIKLSCTISAAITYSMQCRYSHIRLQHQLDDSKSKWCFRAFSDWN